MQRHMRRMLLALVLSTTCYFGTEAWVRWSTPAHQRDTTKNPVALLDEASNEVQRKEVKRVIWERATLNENLYPGEAIRTNDKAEAKLRIIKSGTVIHLDPDSLVVLEENENGLQLDFLQGNLFVQGGQGSAGGDLTLKTDSGKIKLNSADLNLSKDKSGQTSLEVFKGQAELSNGGKTLQLTQDKGALLGPNGATETLGRVQITAPQAGETRLINLVRNEKLEVTWKPLPAGYQVVAELGADRARLAKLTQFTIPGEAGRLSLPIKSGKWHLRISATSTRSDQLPLTSSVVPFQIEPKAAPLPLEPNAEKALYRNDPNSEVEFRWASRNQYESQVLEISADPLFRKTQVKESLSADAQSLKVKLADGKWNWRITGYLKNKNQLEPLTSQIVPFELAAESVGKPPLLLSPAGSAHLPFAEVQKRGLTFRWKGNSQTANFIFTLERSKDGAWTNVYEKEVVGPILALTQLGSAAYRWKVSNKESLLISETAEFMIDAPPRLDWVIREPVVPYEYDTPTPSLNAQWKSFASTSEVSYRYRFAESDKALTEQPWQSTKQTVMDVLLPNDGTYRAVVEAVNAKGELLAQSEPKTFKVAKRPLLPAPRWADTTPTVLRADSKGNLSFGWLGVNGAQNYLMVIENSQGKVMEQRTVTRTAASVSRLRPGQYRVKVRAIDARARPGVEGEPRPVEVPNTSDIQAPKIKAMKVN